MTLGVYIQVPFCQTRCTYCNFHTGVVSRDRYGPYANAICREIEASNLSASPALDTVYFGGGTPSLLDPELLARILYALRQTNQAEFTEISLSKPIRKPLRPQGRRHGSPRASTASASARNPSTTVNYRPLAGCIAAMMSTAPQESFAPPVFPISAWI
jgi:hypothetical protein